MTKSDRNTPLTISLQIPTYWTPEQAFAVFELVDELRDTIWRCYALQLQEEYRDQRRHLDAETCRVSASPLIQWSCRRKGRPGALCPSSKSPTSGNSGVQLFELRRQQHLHPAGSRARICSSASTSSS